MEHQEDQEVEDLPLEAVVAVPLLAVVGEVVLPIPGEVAVEVGRRLLCQVVEEGEEVHPCQVEVVGVEALRQLQEVGEEVVDLVIVLQRKTCSFFYIKPDPGARPNLLSNCWRVLKQGQSKY